MASTVRKALLVCAQRCHELPRISWPTFDATAGAFAFLQGEDELGALAVGDIEHARFPRVQRGDGGRACERFVPVRLVHQRVGALTRCTLL